MSEINMTKALSLETVKNKTLKKKNLYSFYPTDTIISRYSRFICKLGKLWLGKEKKKKKVSDPIYKQKFYCVES